MCAVYVRILRGMSFSCGNIFANLNFPTLPPDRAMCETDTGLTKFTILTAGDVKEIKV
jgi:hypothetical protein